MCFSVMPVPLDLQPFVADVPDGVHRPGSSWHDAQGWTAAVGATAKQLRNAATFGSDGVRHQSRPVGTPPSEFGDCRAFWCWFTSLDPPGQSTVAAPPASIPSRSADPIDDDPAGAPEAVLASLGSDFERDWYKRVRQHVLTTHDSKLKVWLLLRGGGMHCSAHNSGVNGVVQTAQKLFGDDVNMTVMRTLFQHLCT